MCVCIYIYIYIYIYMLICNECTLCLYEHSHTVDINEQLIELHMLIGIKCNQPRHLELLYARKFVCVCVCVCVTLTDLYVCTDTKRNHRCHLELLCRCTWQDDHIHRSDIRCACLQFYVCARVYVYICNHRRHCGALVVQAHLKES